MDDRRTKEVAADWLIAAEHELRTAQALLRSDDSDENRARYALAIESLKQAEQAAQAALNGWTAVGEA